MRDTKLHSVTALVGHDPEASAAQMGSDGEPYLKIAGVSFITAPNLPPEEAIAAAHTIFEAATVHYDHAIDFYSKQIKDAECAEQAPAVETIDVHAETCTTESREATTRPTTGFCEACGKATVFADMPAWGTKSIAVCSTCFPEGAVDEDGWHRRTHGSGQSDEASGDE